MMGQVFASAPVRKQRLREILLTFLIVGAGLFAASQFNFLAASIAIGALAGVLMMHLAESLWPTREEGHQTQWPLFFGVLVLPCAVVSGGLLIYAVRLHEVTDSYFGALILSAVLYAPVQLWRIAKRVPQ